MESPFSVVEEVVMHKFDRFCQKILKGEAVNYYRCMDNLRKREIMISEVSEEQFEQLATVDEYFFEYQHFDVQEYDIKIRNELLAEALNELTERRRTVVLLSYFLDMSDADIARRMNLVRSTVNEHKKTSIKMLRKIMEKRANERKK